MSANKGVWLYKLGKLCGMIVLVVLSLFCLQNMGLSRIDFLIWSFEMPRALIYALVFLCGGLVGLLLRRRRMSTAHA